MYILVYLLQLKILCQKTLYILYTVWHTLCNSTNNANIIYYVYICFIYIIYIVFLFVRSFYTSSRSLIFSLGPDYDRGEENGAIYEDTMVTLFL